MHKQNKADTAAKRTKSKKPKKAPLFVCKKQVEKNDLDEKKKKAWQSARAIGSILQDLHETHGVGERELDKGGADGVEGGKKKKQNKTRGANQCWKSVHDRWQTRVLLLFSPSFSPTLSLSFSLPLHFPSLTID